MMKRLCLLLVGASVGFLANANSMATPANARNNPGTIEANYPHLASGSLTYAKLGQLPEGVLLQAGTLKITAEELRKKVECMPENIREQYKKNMFFLLAQETEEKLLSALAKSKFNQAKTDCAGQTDKEIIQRFIQDTVTDNVGVSEEEVAEYYEQNKGMCGNAAFGKVKDELREYALQEKQQKAVNDYIRTLGKRVSIVVSSSWVKEQAKLALDNPVDKARTSGKLSVVDFGAIGCRPCDMMTPVLKALKEKFAGKVNVLFIHVRQENILAARYGVQTIPIQVFFDKTGKEVYRHLGFFPQEEIEKKLREMDVQ